MDGFLSLALLFLVAGLIAVPIASRLGLGSVLGYLIAGIVIGPLLKRLGVDVVGIQHFAEFGVVMMLFLVGLELEPRMLWNMRNRLLGLGGLQVGLTTLLVMGIAMAFGQPWTIALTAGMVLALSSTAIVLQTLNEKSLMGSEGGRASFSVLLFQDIAVIPMLAFLPLLALPELAAITHGAEGGGHGGGFVEHLPAWQRGLVTVAAIVAVVVGGSLLSRPLFRFIAVARLQELFTAVALAIVVGIALLMTLVGLSPALGTFLAGVVLANSEYRHQLEADLDPFKGLLLGLFFITVGMRVDMISLLPILHWVIILAAAVILTKFCLILALVRISGRPMSTAFRSGLLLAQGGEFGFVLLDLSLESALLPGVAGQILFAAVIISMILTPFLIRHNGRLANHFCALRHRNDELQDIDDLEHEAEQLDQHVIICGYGRIGQNLGRLLDHEGFPYVALDLDPGVVREAHEAGEPVHYGDASRAEILDAAGLDRASVVVLSFDEHGAVMKMLQRLKKTRPELPVLVRTRHDAHLDELEAAGATEVMPEAIEASLMMGGQLLLLLKVPGSRIFKIMREIRADHYKLLRDFFHGQEAIDLEHDEAFLERLHTITLPEKAFAVGHTIEDLHLWDWDISVTAVRRGGIRGEAPAPETRLLAGDVLVLAGTPQHLEHAEGLVLHGH